MGISKWNAGIIRPVPVAPTGPYADSSAPGVWTLDQQAYWQKQGLWPTQGNVNPDLFIENLFSTYLYTGDGSSAQNINNGINLAGKGGMVWVKSRSNATTNVIVDTSRFVSSSNIQCIFSDSTSAASASANEFGSFNSNGFSIPYNTTAGWTNFGTRTFASWTFREQPKFFDIVTYTGDGTTPRNISHNLGSVPGCIIIKTTSTTGNWFVWHRSLGTNGLLLNFDLAAAGYTFASNLNNSTSTQITVGSGGINDSGVQYVAYLFAHDAGGFGLTGTDNVISCGTFTASAGETATVTLGYEPQFLLFKPSSTTGDWQIVDTMRPWPVAADAFSLKPNTTAAEANFGAIKPSATGFYATSNLTANATYIYIAIRRGPMKVPTLGTSVFNALSRTGTAATATVSTTILPDLVMSQARSGMFNVFYDRLRGAGATLSPNLGSDAESFVANGISAFNNNSYTVGTDASQNRINWNTYTYANWLFSRAPGFFDEVCYTGTGVVGRQVTHNLSVAPEMYIVKVRNAAGENWESYWASLGNTKSIYIQATNAATTSSVWNNTSPTSSYFVVGATGNLGPVNFSGYTYVAYLFATCPGVSKVGSYTGTGALQTVACGFTSGARFVLIKRADSTGDWYVWDSARGITSGNDPYLLLNSTAAEVTSTNYVDTDTTGFKVTAAAPAALNAVGGTYIFLAIA